MAYTRARADWLDFPNTTTPITQAQLDQWDQAIYELKTVIFNPKDYGASAGASAATNNTAIAAAVSDASAAGGGTILLQERFDISAAISVPNFVNFLGIGQSSGLRATGNHYIFNLNPANRTRFANFAIEATSTQSSGGGFDFTNAAYNIWLDNIWVINNLFVAFNIAPGTGGNYWIDRVRFNASTGIGTGFQFGDGTNKPQDINLTNVIGSAGTTTSVTTWVNIKNNVDSIYMYGNTFYQGVNGIIVGEAGGTTDVYDCKFTDTMVDAVTGVGIDVVKCRSLNLVNCTIQSGGSATSPGVRIGAGAKSVTMVGGTVEFQVGDGVSILNSSQNTKLIGVNIVDNNAGNGAGNHGVSVAANANDWLIDDCTIGNGVLGTGHQKYGVNIASGTSNRFWITNNRFTGNETGVINNLGTGFQTIIRDNYPDQALPAVASAATITVPAGSPPVLQVTGTTNITSVTAGMASQRVTLLFTGILTFTDGSNLKLNGNFVTTADDTITLVCDGTNWYETSRSAN
jgi:hypothetical protein